MRSVPERSFRRVVQIKATHFTMATKVHVCRRPGPRGRGMVTGNFSPIVGGNQDDPMEKALQAGASAPLTQGPTFRQAQEQVAAAAARHHQATLRCGQE